MQIPLSRLIAEALLEIDTPAEPPGLPLLNEGTHQSLGTMPAHLCHLFLVVQTVRNLRGDDAGEVDSEATRACVIFDREVA